MDLLPAVSDQESMARFHIARRNRSTNHLDGFGTTQTGGVQSTQLVPAVTLDWLADWYTPPDVMKIDVEEAEAPVPAGGPRALGLASTIICEVAARNAAAVRDLLTGHGYALHDGDLPPGERVPAAGAPPNTLAVRGSGRPAADVARNRTGPTTVNDRPRHTICHDQYLDTI